MFISVSKTVIEVISVMVDFTDDLATGETISTYEVSVSVFSGADANPSEILYRIPELHGNTVEQRIKQGVPGVIYSILVEASTSTSRLLEKNTRIAVLPDLGQGGPPFNNTYSVTSQPYPLNDSTFYQSPSLDSITGKLNFQPTMGPESITGAIDIVDLSIYGAAKSYLIPFENIQADIELVQIDIYGDAKNYDMLNENITGTIALLSIDIYGDAVSYDNPFESIRGSITVTSIEITS